MTDVQIFFVFCLAPITVYGVAKLIIVAYFRAKARYMRSLFDGNYDPSESGNGPTSSSGDDV